MDRVGVWVRGNCVDCGTDLEDVRDVCPPELFRQSGPLWGGDCSQCRDFREAIPESIRPQLRVTRGPK